MTWEQIKTFIVKVSQHPLTITIVFVLCSFACALFIFSRTSIGKKAINKLTSLYYLGDQKAKETLEKVKEVEILANEKIEGLKAEYEQKVAVLVSIVAFYEETVFLILEEIPNAKVQARLAQFKESYQEKKNEITSVIGEIYQDFNLAVEKKENEIRKEYEGKIEYLENQIKQLGLYFDELKGAYDNGEREEEADSNPTEEAL